MYILYVCMHVYTHTRLDIKPCRAWTSKLVIPLSKKVACLFLWCKYNLF